MLLAGAALASLASAPFIHAERRDNLRLSDILALSGAACRQGLGGDFWRRQGEALVAPAAYAEAAAKFNQGPPPLMAGLGATSMKITTANPKAQAYFDQGLRMLHGFNHAEAAKAFREAQRLDPQCAMCFWGEAFALGPNINAPMDPANAAPAYKAARAASERAGKASDKEQALISALIMRYPPKMPAERSAFDRAYSAAMHEVAEQFADDDTIQTLAVEAIMDTQPWDYWQPDGVTPKGAALEAVARLESVLKRNPNYVGALHLYIHMVEASNDPWRAEKAADRLGGLAPKAGHLVHMPAHIYYRVGRFRDSIKANIAGAKADEDFIATGAASPMYQYGYYTHNLHFIVASAQMSGDGQTALAYARKLDAALPMEALSLSPLAAPVKAAPWFAKAQFADAATLAASQPPAGAPPYIMAAWRYARAIGLAKLGRLKEARADAAQLEQESASNDWSAFVAAGLPLGDVVKLMAHVVRAHAFIYEKKYIDAAGEYEAALAIQGGIPYQEPPTWYYPVRQSLAASYLLAGQPARAEREFFAALVQTPNSAYAYWGLAEAKKAQGDAGGYRAAREMFTQAFAGGSRAIRAEDL
jgi:Tfp pilus assembly protein PilF